MLNRIYRDPNLYGHALVSLPKKIEQFHEGGNSQQTKAIGNLFRKYCLTFISASLYLSAVPLGLAAKALHKTYQDAKQVLPYPMKSALALPLILSFPSQENAEKAFLPNSVREVQSRIIASEFPVQIKIDPDSNPAQAPCYNPGTQNLLEHSLWENEHLCVFYPKEPRVPHHLAIQLKKNEIQNLSDVSRQENRALFETIAKISEIYHSIHLKGYVLALYDTPQDGHNHRHVIEIIPNLPHFNDIKNTADKADCNRYVLFRSANVTPLRCKSAIETVHQNISFWKKAFTTPQKPLERAELTIDLPHTRLESHQVEANHLLQRHFAEIMQSKGANIANALSAENLFVPEQEPTELKTVNVAKCFFCDSNVLSKQRIFHWNEIEVLYNMRKGAKMGCNFLILPSRHTEKIYDLTEQEIDRIQLVRKALVEVLKEMHPEHEVVIYVQNTPSVGQTVFHTHEQVVAIDPQNIALFWTMQSLFPSDHVKDEEFAQVKKVFTAKMEKKIDELSRL